MSVSTDAPPPKTRKLAVANKRPKLATLDLDAEQTEHEESAEPKRESFSQIKVKIHERIHAIPVRRDRKNKPYIRLNDIWDFDPDALGVGIDKGQDVKPLPAVISYFNSQAPSIRDMRVNIALEDVDLDNTTLTMHKNLGSFGELLMGASFSGGGARASVFHLGAIRRMMQLKLLDKIDTFTSVSGASITMGLLALAWEELKANNFDDELFRILIEEVLKRFTKHNIAFNVLSQTFCNPMTWVRKASSVVMPSTTPTTTATLLAEQYEIAEANAKKEVWALYKDQLTSKFVGPFDSLNGTKNLKSVLSQALPDPKAPDIPHFVFCATDIRTGRPIYFTKCCVGELFADILDPPDIINSRYAIPRATCVRLADTVKLSEAIAASSGHPFMVTPLLLPYSVKIDGSDVHEFIYAGDGGIYDNLGMDPLTRPNMYKKGVCNLHITVFVSDAGLPVPEQDHPSTQEIVSVIMRANNLMGDQATRLRKGWVKHQFASTILQGAVWCLDDFWDYYFSLVDYGRQMSATSGQSNPPPVKQRDEPSIVEKGIKNFEHASDKKSSIKLAEKLLEKCTPAEDYPDLVKIFTEHGNTYNSVDILNKITGFRTDLNGLSTAEFEILQSMGYTAAAFSIRMHYADALEKLDSNNIKAKAKFNIRYAKTLNVPYLYQNLKYSANVPLSFVFNNTFKSWGEYLYKPPM